MTKETYIAGKEQKIRELATQKPYLIETKYQLILYGQSIKGLKHDSPQVIPNLRAIQKYKPRYIVADKGYDSEKIRTYINDIMKSLAMIPIKNNLKTGKYRLSTQAIFSQKNIRPKKPSRNSKQSRIKNIRRKKHQQKHNIKKQRNQVKNMLYNIYRTLIIIENAQKTNNKTRQKETDTTTQTNLKTNTTKIQYKK